MRLFAILLLLLIAGLGFALWRGIDLGTGRLAATEQAEDLSVEEVALTAAEPGSEEAVEGVPAVDEVEAEVAMEPPAEAAEAPAATAEAPAEVTEAPAETAETPASEGRATETATVEAPAAPDEGTAETPALEAAEAPAPRTLPDDPIDPADALAEIAPDLSVPSTPSVRSAREPTEEPAAEASAEPAVEPSATVADLASAAPGTRRITGDRVNLRQGPDTGTASLGLLSRDDAVEVLEAEGDWLRVRTQGGEEGWVAARFLSAPQG